MSVLRRRAKVLAAGKSPSRMAMERTYNRAVLNGGVTQDFSANVENIREICRKLSYTDGLKFFNDATYCYVPSSYGESKNFAQVQNKRNLIYNSGDLSQSTWVKNQCTVTSNAVANPNSSTSYYITDNGVNTQHYVGEAAISVTTGQIYTITLFLAKADDDWVQILPSTAGFSNTYYINFNLTTGTFGAGIGYTNPTAVSTINGFWKVNLTLTATSTASNVSTYLLLGTNNTNATRNVFYTGTGRKFVNFGGVQVELGAYATPYQKTVAAGDGIVDFKFTRATSATVTNKLGVIEDSCYNLLVNSATGTTQTITVSAGTYNLSFFGTGSYTLSGAATGTLNGAGINNRVNQSFVCTAGSLTLTVTGSITKVQFAIGGLRDYLKTTNRLNVPRLDYSRGLGEPELFMGPQTETSYVDLWNNAILNQTNWVLYWEGYLFNGVTTGMSVCLSDTNTAAANSNQIGWYNLNTPFFNIANVRTNGPSNAANNSLCKFGIQYNNGTVNFYRNGVNIWSNQNIAIFNYRYLCVNSGGSTFSVDKICLFNRTLTPAEMISLTT